MMGVQNIWQTSKTNKKSNFNLGYRYAPKITFVLKTILNSGLPEGAFFSTPLKSWSLYIFAIFHFGRFSKLAHSNNV